MKTISREIFFEEYQSFDELPQEEKDLVKAAIAASAGSYSPYSGFRVGAAVLLDNGETVTGSNQENIAYPSGLCAERVALFHAQSEFPESSVRMLAIAARTDTGKVMDPVMPCGSCRQVMAEYEDRHNTPMKVFMVNGEGKTLVAKNMEALLPMRFKADFLKGKK